LDFFIEDVKRNDTNDDDYPEAHRQIILGGKIAINYPDQTGREDSEAQKETEIPVEDKPPFSRDFLAIHCIQAYPKRKLSS